MKCAVLIKSFTINLELCASWFPASIVAYKDIVSGLYIQFWVLKRLLIIEWTPQSFRRTSIRRLAKHYQLIRPVITPAVRKRSELTPVWKQSDSANTATKPLHGCVCICKGVCMCAHMWVWTEVSLRRLWLCELSNWSGCLGVEGAHLEGIYCIIQSIIAAVGA